MAALAEARPSRPRREPLRAGAARTTFRRTLAGVWSAIFASAATASWISAASW